MTPDDLRAAWLALANQPVPAGRMRLSELPVETPAGRLHAALDAQGDHHLFIPVPHGTPVREDRRSSAVTITRTEIVIKGGRYPTIDLTCHDSGLTDIFGRLSSDVVSLVEAEPSAYLTAAYTVVDRWRRLLERRRSGMGRDALLGLFAELTVLQTTVELDPSRRIDHWHGPTGARHDFRRPGTAVEVKATGAREGLRVGIHGVEQLEPEPGDRLLLAAFSVEEHDTGTTVDALLDDIVDRGADATGVRTLAEATGWSPGAHDERLRIREQRWYDVDGTFPRIVPDSFVGGTVPAGVTQLTYSVDLTGPAPVPLTTAAVEAVVQTLATG